MSRLLDTQEFLDTVCQMLAEGRTNVPVPVTGNSMVPFLHNGDMVFLSTPDSPLKKGDILLYQRSSGRYILHRLYKICRDGSLVMVGDAQQSLELLPSQDQVRARVVSAVHKGKPCPPNSLRWWLYRHVWLWLRPFRHILMRLKGKLNALHR